MHRKKLRIYIWLGIFVAYIFGGILGYMLIEGYSFLEAVYMVVITISTVGFGEVKPLSPEGRIYTTIFIIFNLLIVGIVLRNVISYLFDEQFFRLLKERAIKRKMKSIENHTIVCGFGRNGLRAVKELLAHKEKVVVIENDVKVMDLVEEDIRKQVIFIEGDATKEEILQKAKVCNAKALITTLPIDADNVFIVLTARYLNPKITIVSRASDEHSDIKLKRAGADYVILPDMVGGVRMAKLVTEPDVIEFLEYLMVKTHEDVNLVEVQCSELPEKYLNHTLKELDIRRKSGANIIGMKLENGKYIFNPSADMKLTVGAKLFVLGTPEQIENFKTLLKAEKS